MFATFSAGHGQTDIRVAVIDRPELLECVLDADAPELDLIVLGEPELAALAGRPVREPWEAVAAIERLRGFGPEAVLASLGGGAVLVDSSGAFHAETETETETEIETGPGDRALRVDALLAGFLTAGARGPRALAAALLTAATGPGAAVVTRDSSPREATVRPPTVHVTWVDALEMARAYTAS